MSVLLQVIFVIHVVRTGRDTKWIWIVLMLPFAGSLAYFFLEVLPDLRNSRSTRRMARKMESVIQPGKRMDDALQDFETASTADNAIRLAEELSEQGLDSEAAEIYRQSLRGPHENDHQLLQGLANAEFRMGDYAGARATLDRLIEHNPDFKNADAHLLYARACELSGDEDAALHEYETLDGYFPGPEATYYLAKLLKSRGQAAAARALFDKIVATAKISGRHYQSVHREMITEAEREIL
ncbi:MAG: tetratricopeptide repeat protein [Halieaceae bacterium]|nr:tetratricopeptide repeat protein [Halieaceae bacterium]